MEMGKKENFEELMNETKVLQGKQTKTKKGKSPWQQGHLPPKMELAAASSR